MSRRETATRGRHSLAALGACLALLVGAGCGGDDEAAGEGARRSATVNVASFEFTPDPIKVKAGGRVTWVNQDKAPHTAQTEGRARGGFDTGRLDTGEKKAVRLDRPGKLSYLCVYHRFMTGTVEVVE